MVVNLLQAQDMQDFDNKGFVALTATIIVAAALLIVVVNIASNGFYGRFNILDAEVKEVSRALAEGCVETAILKYAQDSTYTGDNDVVRIGDKECVIKSVSGTSPISIDTQAVVNNTYTNLRVGVESTNFTVVSWQELPNF